MTVCSWCGKLSPHGGVCGCPTDDAIDAIYSSVDRLMTAGESDSIDQVLAELDPSHLNVIVALAYLSITMPARSLLKERRPFAARLRRHLEKTDPARVEALLRGLEEP